MNEPAVVYSSAVQLVLSGCELQDWETLLF